MFDLGESEDQLNSSPYSTAWPTRNTITSSARCAPSP